MTSSRCPSDQNVNTSLLKPTLIKLLRFSYPDIENCLYDRQEISVKHKHYTEEKFLPSLGALSRVVLRKIHSGFLEWKRACNKLGVCVCDWKCVCLSSRIWSVYTAASTAHSQLL